MERGRERVSPKRRDKAGMRLGSTINESAEATALGNYDGLASIILLLYTWTRSVYHYPLVRSIVIIA